MKKKHAIVASGLTLALALLLVTACSPSSSSSSSSSSSGAQASQTEASETSSTDSSTASSTETSTDAGAQAIQDIYDGLDAQNEAYAPKVTTLADGTKIQRTPSDPGGYFQMMGVKNLTYNTYYLDADNRGCGACHENLAETVANMDFYHLELDNGLGTTVTVDDCRICHDQGTGYMEKIGQFGDLIHGIHRRSTFTGDCMSCHSGSADGNGLQLWDDSKYTILRGISSVENVTGDFSYDQTTTTDGMFFASWFSTEGNIENIGKQIAGVEEDDETFDNWTINVTGLVNNPYSITLKDLIAQAPSKTFISANECVMNPPGGEQIANVEVTGIPISWLLEKAGGVKDGATAVMSTAPDGWSRGNTLENLNNIGGYLVYEINGQRLQWGQGYPLTTWYPGQCAPSCIRWVSELEVVDTPVEHLKMWDGWKDDNGNYVNKPSCGILHFQEGQVIDAGKPYTFEGYAYGFDEQIIGVEYSLDQGATWTRFDTSDSDFTKWVYWHFTYTPDADPSAYVLEVRAVLADGTVSVTPDRVMFNAQ